ncbi:tail fiber protein [Caudoviricetes sp.]|nr:tail fiber protein [Caudoviricetes sp.]
MSKLVLNDISSGYATATALNTNNTLIETALENTLSLDGTAPNAMTADFDMNGNDILNVATINSASLILGGVDITGIVSVPVPSVALDMLRVNAGATAYELRTPAQVRTDIGAGTGSGDALVANPLSQFAATTSLQLKGVISDETGSGALVFADSPTLITPALGTPTALVGTNISGTAASLTAGTVTTNANLTGHITSVGNATSLGSFTVAQLNTAISDADVATGGGTATGTNTGDQVNITGNAATVTTNANLTGHVTSTGNATVLGSFTLAQLNTAISDADVQPLDAALTALAAGSDFVQFTGPTTSTKVFTLPNASSTLLYSGGALGTPSSGVGTNLTGTAAGLTAGTVTTNANLTGDVTSVGNAATVVKINGTLMSGLATGILKNTTTTGVPSIAVAGDFPTLNQNTSGTAAGLSATLAVGSGGTNLTTIADAAILATNSANTLTAVTATALQSIRRNAGNTAWESFTPAAAGAGYATVQEEGTGLTQRTTINFVGAGITATDNAGLTKTDVTLDATLNSLAALGTAADKLAYTTGIDTWAETGLTAAGRAILDDANAAAQLVTLGAAPLAGATFTGDIAMSGASIFDANASVAAHATTCDPWSLGNYVTLTGGAVTFTAMANAPQAGAEVELYMNAAHVFTDGAVFEVDGDANYTATIGDRVLLRAKSTTVFTVHPRKKDGTAVVGTYENDILNGEFRIAQIGTSFAAPASGAYDLDGWINSNTSAAVFTVAQAAGSSTGKLCRTMTVTTADASVAAGDLVNTQHRIEGYNAVKYLSKGFTVGFRVKSAVTGIHCIQVYNGTASYVLEYTINVANTWEYKTLTFPATPALASTTNAYGFFISFTNMCGSTYQTTAGSWNAGAFGGTANQVNDMATIGNVFAIEDVTLNPGASVAVKTTTFEQDLLRCQRYYESSFPIGVAPVQNAGTAGAHGAVQVVGASASQGCAMVIPFHVPKRAAGGTFTTYNPSAANAQIRNINTGSDCSAIGVQLSGKDSYTLSTTTPAGSAAGQLLALHWAYSSRL